MAVNALNRMINASFSGVEFISVDTDAQALDLSRCAQKIQIGVKLTKGVGAGSDVKLGWRAIEDNREVIAKALNGARTWSSLLRVWVEEREPVHPYHCGDC